jgi:hypothetical protein
MGMTIESLAELAAEIKALGYDDRTAGRYAALIGDTPGIDEQGRIVVIDQNGREVARLKLKFFEG